MKGNKLRVEIKPLETKRKIQSQGKKELSFCFLPLFFFFYDYTAARDAHEDLVGDAENYELLDMDDFLPAAEQPKTTFTYPRRDAHASQQD